MNLKTIHTLKKLLNEQEKNDRLFRFVETTMNNSINELKKEIEGHHEFGNYDEEIEIECVEYVKLKDLSIGGQTILKIEVMTNCNRWTYDTLINFLEYRLVRLFPNVKVIVDDIKNINKFGPGIDW